MDNSNEENSSEPKAKLEESSDSDANVGGLDTSSTAGSGAVTSADSGAVADTAAESEDSMGISKSESEKVDASEDKQASKEVAAVEAEGDGGSDDQPAPKAGPLNWYVVHAYSGFELKAKQALEERIRSHGVEDHFGQILVPQETVVELVRGQKRTTNRKFWPGYMLVEMVMNQDTWHLVKETQKVTGFLGGDVSEPEPMPEEEVARILGQIAGGEASPRARANFSQGETVKVIDGPFADFNGTIEEVRPDKGIVKVLISIFGRATPVELEFYQVERA